jgi:phage I-like protein
MNRFFAILKDLAGVAPEEFQIFPAGTVEIEGEDPVIVDEAGARELIAAFDARGNDMVIDYEHQTLKDVQAPAAGWIKLKRLSWRGADGLWAEAVEWTTRAKGFLGNKEYRYFSPVAVARDGRIVRLLNIALTNSPKINHLQPIVAKWSAMETKIEKEVIMIEKLKKLLGLAADAGEDKVLEAVTLSVNKASTVVACKEILEALGAKAEANREEVVRIVASLKGSTVVACKEVLEALGAQANATREEVIRIVASLKAPGDVAVQLSQQVAALTKKITEMEQQDLVALALKEGKTSPEELDKWGRELALKTPDQFRKIVLSRPVGSVIPVTDIAILKDQTAAVSDDTQKAVNRMMGVSEETFKKYNK